jgi:hypothetical protein
MEQNLRLTLSETPMPRPYIEFIQSQHVPWSDWFSADVEFPVHGLQIKCLSEDDETGAMSCLIRYPKGWSQPLQVAAECADEFFVLDGAVTMSGKIYTKHNYAFLPSGYPRLNWTSEAGAIVLAFFDRKPTFVACGKGGLGFDPRLLIEGVDTVALKWDNSNMDPNINHLQAYRKNLRLDPEGNGRTYLLAGLPQGFPASGQEPLERHPHNEEMFMIYGDMPCSLGVMRAGAYFWRPPGIWHGADCTRAGFMMFMRTPGTNTTISDWAVEPFPVTFEPEHFPQVPAQLSSYATPLADPIQY